MGSKKNRNKSCRTLFKRRKFIGNRFISEVQKDVSSTEDSPPRGSELRPNDKETSSCSTLKRQMLACDDGMFQCVDEEDYYIFFNFKLLMEMVVSMCKCSSCGDNSDIRGVVECTMGFAVKLEVICLSCTWKLLRFMSKEFPVEGKATRSPFEVKCKSFDSL